MHFLPTPSMAAALACGAGMGGAVAVAQYVRRHDLAHTRFVRALEAFLALTALRAMLSGTEVAGAVAVVRVGDLVLAGLVAVLLFDGQRLFVGARTLLDEARAQADEYE